MQELKKINNNIPTDEYIDPLISVITVVFNGEKHLGNTIKSIIPNKNSSVEYIVARLMKPKSNIQAKSM